MMVVILLGMDLVILVVSLQGNRMDDIEALK